MDQRMLKTMVLKDFRRFNPWVAGFNLIKMLNEITKSYNNHPFSEEIEILSSLFKVTLLRTKMWKTSEKYQKFRKLLHTKMWKASEMFQIKTWLYFLFTNSLRGNQPFFLPSSFCCCLALPLGASRQEKISEKCCSAPSSSKVSLSLLQHSLKVRWLWL